MLWTPKYWIAILLGFFIQPLGMLYVVRLKLAIIYFFLGITVGVLDYWLKASQAHWNQYISFSLILMIICAVHVYFIVKASQGITDRPWYSKWYGLLSFPLVIFICIFLFRAFLFEPFRIPATSMSPTLNPGDTVIASKWGYGNYETFGVSIATGILSKEINRGDVIIFDNPKNPSDKSIKRVIGLPGDKVTYDKNELIISGQKITRIFQKHIDQYDVISEAINTHKYFIKVRPESNSAKGIVEVPKGHLFVMGDNRDNSNDSRYWGFVPLNSLIGKVVYHF